LSKNPRYKRAWLNLGLVHTRAGRYGDAFNAFRQVMNDAQAWNNVGYVCMMDGQYDNAESFFLEAVKLSPSHYPTAQENLKRVQELRDM
jgi:Flp pilus assembly protein TadD